MKKALLQVTIDKQLREQLKLLAVAENRNLSNLVETLLKFAVRFREIERREI